MRGQTILDFAIGMGLFLLTLAFIFSFVPTIFDPFTTGSSANLVVADRAATALAGDFLAPSTAGTGSLSTGCVVAFFEANQGLADETCTADVDVTDLNGMLSLDGRNADVTVHALNGTADDPAEIDWDGGSYTLTRETSESVPSDVAFATRTVRIAGQQYRLTVQVW